MVKTLLSDRSWGIFLAAAFHTAAFIAGGIGLAHKAEYGMDFSNGAAEVDLVAAPAPMMSAASVATAQQAPQETPPAQEPEDVPEPQKAPAPTAVVPAVAPVPNAILRTTNLSGPLGDGSSAVPGTDATTIHRAGTSGSYYKPGYYRNPPPPYPAEARRMKQEGRVLLEATISVDGSMIADHLEQSSGFPLLDEAALKGVQHWRFRPATVAGVRVESTVEIPIRFQLK